MNKKLLALIVALTTILLSTANVSAVRLYAPDGRTVNVHFSDVDSWKNVGWYDFPVTTVYAPDGRNCIIAKNNVPAWEKVGWYSFPVATVYAPDGRSHVIAKSDVSAWEKVGWSTLKPLTEQQKKEIFSAFKKADEFLYLWIYGQYYIDWYKTLYAGSSVWHQVTHPELNTASKLKSAFRLYFPEPLATQFINYLSPMDVNGKLYIIYKGGVGDSMEYLVDYDFTPYTENSCILTLHHKHYHFQDAIYSYRILCTYQDNRWLFSDFMDDTYFSISK